MPSAKPVIGVLGGMGPEATAYFLRLLIEHTRAACDQEHARVLVWNDPGIPPRTEAILGTGPSPLPRLLAGVRTLERGGAGLIVMPCLTAHYWAAAIRKAARVPFVDLLEEAVRRAKAEVRPLKRAGLVASTGTVRAGLFTLAFEKAGVKVLTPEPKAQERVAKAIFGPGGIKAGVAAGAPRRTIVAAARRLAARGADAIIAGCTEVPLVLRPGDLAVPLIEPMAIGARACLKMAGYPVKAQGRKTR